MKRTIIALLLILTILSSTTGCMVINDLVDSGFIDGELLEKLWNKIIQEVKSALLLEMKRSVTEFRATPHK